MTKDRFPLFRPDANAELLLTTLEDNRSKGRFELHAFAVMPDHVHLLVTPAADVPLEKLVQFVKGGYSFRLKKGGDLWDRGHFDKRIADPDAYEACRTYIEQNPVRARLVRSSEEYPFSSASRRTNVDPRPSWL